MKNETKIMYTRIIQDVHSTLYPKRTMIKKLNKIQTRKASPKLTPNQLKDLRIPQDFVNNQMDIKRFRSSHEKREHPPTHVNTLNDQNEVIYITINKTYC